MEQIKLTKYEQICVTVESGDGYFVFDPGSEASIDSILEKGNVTAAFVSHSHPDHFNVENLRRLGCTIYGTKEVVEGLASEGVSATLVQAHSDIKLGSLSIQCFWVDHGPVSAPIHNLAFHVIVSGVSMLFLGDIKFPSPLPQADFEVVFIPVGGSKVFDIDEAIQFAISSNFTGVVVPAHYHGRADRAAGQNFKDRSPDTLQVMVLDVGEQLIFDAR